MSNNFITNNVCKSLKDRINALVTASAELKFLVGFFYFSGIKELYESLKNNPSVTLKILVGLNVDIWNEKIIEFADANRGSSSNNDIRKKFFNSIKKSINNELFDTKEFYEQVKFFIHLINNNRLHIRKTLEPNHSKLYVFKLSSDQIGRNSLFITGSSNLTSSGLTTQEEFNVEISDYGVDEAEKYFDDLWNKAVEITENEKTKSDLVKIIEKETLVKEITPFEAYVLALKIYLDTFEKKEIGDYIINLLENCGYKPYLYQKDAIEQALAILEKHNGVILADVVGLGKTVIACAIACLLKKRGVIICPPGIIGNPKSKDAGWNMYKEQFRLYDWEVWSLGDLEKLQEFVSKTKDIEVIIVDEAHRFRNQDTKSYELLRNICRTKQVILLTATPFNNRPADILSLLKLFTVPKKSGITLENNLLDKFLTFEQTFKKLSYIKKYHNSRDKDKKEKAHANYKSLFGVSFSEEDPLSKVDQRSKYLAKQIRDIIEPVTIRRNRLDLQNNPDYKDEVKNLSKTADPIEWFYTLTPKQSIFYDTVIKKYFADPDEGGQFNGAIYRPFKYEKEIPQEKDLEREENFEYQRQRNLYNFMRRLLVKRFESSFGSFLQSLINFKNINKNVLEFIDKTNKYILDRGLLERIHDKELEEIENDLKEYSEKITKGEYPKNHKIYEIENFRFKEKFINDIKSDIELFEKILKELKALSLVENDPKANCLIENLRTSLQKEQKRKIVIFSEYVDTVKYLQPKLEKEFKQRVLTIAGDLTEGKLEAIYKNFDASFETQENNYNILLTSDKLSEGFNLNRAGMVINYDIPWNPVRVIQRVGRINRISKKVFDEIYIVNFFPTEQGSNLVKSREIAASKMFLIHNTLGEDSKIFDADEEPSPSNLYTKIQQNPDNMEEESFYTKVIKEFYDIKEKHPNLIKEIKNFPTRIKVAKKYTENELLVFIKKGRLHTYCAKYNPDGESKYFPTLFENILKNIKASPEDEPLSLSPDFWKNYNEIKNLQEKVQKSLTGISLEQQAINNLKCLLKINNTEISQYQTFLKMLLEDILDYGTLPDFTIRRLANLKMGNDEQIKSTVKEIEALIKELGENYLEQEKAKIKNLTKEIIVAIENRKV